MRLQQTARIGIATSWNAHSASPALCGKSSSGRQAVWTSARAAERRPQPTLADPLTEPLLSRRELKWLDLYFSEFHHARSILQGDRTTGVFRILCFNRLLAIEHDDEMRAVRGDFIGVPLARGLRHRIDL